MIRVAQIFPKYAKEGDNGHLMAPVVNKEVELILKSMQKYKGPGHDGWNMDFFQHFFELMGEEILGVVDESGMNGFIHDPFNSTFMDIIPKSYFV